MPFPTLEQVENAGREQLCRWYRFLPSGVSKEQKPIMDRLLERFFEVGGFTPSISKRIGWNEGNTP